MNSVMLIGRILFAFMFVASGLNHLTKAEAMVGYATYKKVPAPKLANALSGILMVLGGLSVILGVYADLAQVCLQHCSSSWRSRCTTSGHRQTQQPSKPR